MTTQKLRIATRKSPLALWQAEHVAAFLRRLHPGLQVELLGMTTAGDRFLDTPLASVGGKGLFIKELEQSLLENRADLAVHSMKDVTVDLPAGLAISAILKREDPRDVLIAADGLTLATLPIGARIGTSSLRRQSQLRALRPDLRIQDLRGNLGTRLKRLDAGDYDAILLAAAGVLRLGLAERISEYLPVETLLPAIAQGAIGIETRADDPVVRDLIAPLEDPATRICIESERVISRRLYGGCQLPIAAHARLQDTELSIQALVARIDGSEILRAESRGSLDIAESLASTTAADLLDRGADRILAELLHE